MNRLAKSSKFWLAVIGTIVALITWKITKDTAFAMYTSSFFGAGIIGTATEDMMKINKGISNQNNQ